MPRHALATQVIAEAIHVVRGQKVLLDADLARLYGVETRALNQAVRRNAERFPKDFAFALGPSEIAVLRSQTVILDRGKGRHRKYPTLAFTEQGVAMLSSVLRSPRAIAVNIQIVRTFVELRRLLRSHAELAGRLDALEQKYDGRFRRVFQAIRGLMLPPALPRRQIGFTSERKKPRSG